MAESQSRGLDYETLWISGLWGVRGKPLLLVTISKSFFNQLGHII